MRSGGPAIIIRPVRLHFRALEGMGTMGPMLRWFVFTIAFGLLPFSLSGLVQVLSGRGFASAPDSLALLFFSVMVCTAQLAAIYAALSDADSLSARSREILNAFFGLFLLGAVVSAVMYGIYMSHDLNDPALQWNGTCARGGVNLDACSAWLSFRVNLFALSVWVAAFAGVLGTWSEWIRSRR
ncbi:MAG TPA: hypothetical protein VGB66_09415 [Longimicrobium sp.]